MRSICISCYSEKMREWKLANPERKKALDKEYRLKNPERCKKKARDRYLRIRHTPEHKEASLRNGRKYYANNLEKMRKKARDAKKTPQNKEKKNAHRRHRRKTDTKYAILESARARLGKAMRAQGAFKTKRTLEILGCTAEFLKSYLEAKFLPGMTWENRGTYTVENPNVWHIDHIKPCSAFDLLDPKQVEECFHYTNLQPLWGADNLAKGDSLPCQDLT